MNWAACVSAVVCRYPWYPGQYWTVPLNTSVLFQQRTSAALATSPFLVLVKSMLLLNVSVRIALVWQRWKSKCTIMEKNPKVSRRQSSCLFYTNHPKHFHSENLNGSLFSSLSFFRNKSPFVDPLDIIYPFICSKCHLCFLFDCCRCTVRTS